MVIGWNGSREHMSFMYVHRIEMGMSPHERVTSRSGPHAVEVIWKMGYGYLSMMHRYLTRREGRQTTGNVSLSNEAWSWRQMDCGGGVAPKDLLNTSSHKSPQVWGSSNGTPDK